MTVTKQVYLETSTGIKIYKGDKVNLTWTFPGDELRKPFTKQLKGVIFFDIEPNDIVQFYKTSMYRDLEHVYLRYITDIKVIKRANK